MIHVDDEQYVGQRTHILDATQAALELLLLAAEAEHLFLGEPFETALFGHLLECFQAFDRLPNGLVIGEHAAEPALADERHFTTLGMCLDGLACGTLGADKENRTAIGHGRLYERARFTRQRQALFEVDDVDLVTFAKDERCHLWVPVTGLMTKVHASL